jgi:HEAT repeat protein
MDPIVHVVEVIQVWKGDIGDTTLVSTARMGASCGYPFSSGRSYLIYARTSRIEEADWSTSLCTRTKPLDQAAEDLEALGTLDLTLSDAEKDAALVETAIHELQAKEEATRLSAATRLRDMSITSERTVAALEEYYRTGNAADRGAAVDAIGRLGWSDEWNDRVIPVLVSALDDEDAEVVRRAIFPLSRMEDHAAELGPQIHRLLEHDDGRVRQAAMSAISRYGPSGYTFEAGLSDIEALLNDPDPAVRSSALHLYVGAASDSAAAARIAQFIMSDPDERVRSKACYALQHMDVHTDKSVEVLLAALGDSSAEVRRAAITAVGRMGAPAAPATPVLLSIIDDADLEAPGRRDWEQAVSALARLAPYDEAAMKAVMEFLDHPSIDVRSQVVVGLPVRGIAMDDVRLPIEKALRDTSIAVRCRALSAIGAFGEGESDVEALFLAAMHDEDVGVRECAARSARKLTSPSEDIVLRLHWLESDDTEAVRRAARGSLVVIEERAKRAAEESAP